MCSIQERIIENLIKYVICYNCNLLTAMIKSLWSLKVIRGSDRHLMEKKKETVAIYFLSDTGPVNAAGILGESVAALNV